MEESDELLICNEKYTTVTACSLLLT